MKKDILIQLRYVITVTLFTILGYISFAQIPDTWVQKKDYGTAVDSTYGAIAFSIGNKGYVGTGYAKRRLNDFWEYDPNTDTWSQKASFISISFFI